jgi:hypothetical protein
MVKVDLAIGFKLDFTVIKRFSSITRVIKRGLQHENTFRYAVFIVGRL